GAAGHDRPIMQWIEIQRALIELDDGKPTDALPFAERALALTQASTSPHERASGEMVLARTLAALHRDHDRAVALIRHAKDVFERSEDRDRLAEVARIYTQLGLH